MRQILLCLLAFAIAGITSAAAEDYSNLASSARALDATSRKDIGISIHAVALLLNASPHSFTPIWVLEKNGDLDIIEDLAAKGFVTVTRKPGLPSGANTDTVFVNYIATEKGNAVISAIVGS